MFVLPLSYETKLKGLAATSLPKLFWNLWFIFITIYKYGITDIRVETVLVTSSSQVFQEEM